MRTPEERREKANRDLNRTVKATAVHLAHDVGRLTGKVYGLPPEVARDLTLALAEEYRAALDGATKTVMKVLHSELERLRTEAASRQAGAAADTASTTSHPTDPSGSGASDPAGNAGPTLAEGSG